MVTAVFLILFSVTGARANDLFESNSTPRPKLVVKAPLNSGKQVIITAEEFSDASVDGIKELLLDERVQGKDILLSTDQPAVIEAAAHATSAAGDRRLLRIIPIGKIASVSQKMAAGFKSYYQNAKTTLQTDRIGLTVLSITVGVDSYIWLHSASFDIHQQTAMVLMNIVMAATFGLDRDLWQKINSPIKNRLIKIFDRIGALNRLSNLKVITSAYVSNFLLGVGVQMTRTGLLSLDHISQAVMTTDFWMSAAKISGLITLTAFAWSETYGSIDAEKNPVAKMMMKRLSEMRGIILCNLASISMVMQPHVYGHMPVYTFLVHGAVGLMVFMNAQKIIDWLERSKTVNKIYKKVQTFENFINSGLNIRTAAPAGSCRALFAR
jgi:hypothetical protein